MSWTREDVARLRRLDTSGATIPDMAKTLGRTQLSVARKLDRIGGFHKRPRKQRAASAAPQPRAQEKQACALSGALGVAPQQAKVLALLADHGDRFCPEWRILDELKGPSPKWSNCELAHARVLVRRIRQAFGPHAVETRRGAGYRLSRELAFKVQQMRSAHAAQA